MVRTGIPRPSIFWFTFKRLPDEGEASFIHSLVLEYPATMQRIIFLYYLNFNISSNY